MKKLGRYWISIIIILFFDIILNIAGLVPAVANRYSLYIYPAFCNITGRIFSVFPFCFGEICMYCGILLLAFALISSLIFIFFRKHNKYAVFMKHFYKALLSVILIVVLIYTFSWSIPLHATLVENELPADREFSLEELQALRSYCINEANAIALRVDRTNNGKVDYPDDYNSRVINAMSELGNSSSIDIVLHSVDSDYVLGNAELELTTLKGFYPDLKPALCSEILDWMDIGGYTYPFSKEVTYNSFVTKLYYPCLAAHELSHFKGFFAECDANFIGYIACINSGDYILAYSAYIDMYYYLNDAYVSSLLDIYDETEAKAIYQSMPQLSSIVASDIYDCEIEYQENVAENSTPAIQELKPVAEAASDAGWSAEDAILQSRTYDGVVNMLLRFFDGILY